MSSLVEYVSGRLFIDGVMGTVISNRYFYCHHRSCPFSLKVILKPLNGMKVVVGVETVLFGFHIHDETDKTRVQVKSEMKMAIDAVSLYPKNPECVAFKTECDEALQTAIQTSHAERDSLIDYEAVKIYALNHPKKSAREVLESCKVKMDVSTICKMRREAKKEIGRATNIGELITNGGHHLLGHDKDDILVFGTPTALHFITVTPIIQCDGPSLALSSRSPSCISFMPCWRTG